MEGINEIVRLFAINSGFDSVKYFARFKNHDVFVALNEGDIAFTGFPILIIQEDNNVRFTTKEENFQIMEIATDTSFSGEVL